MVASNVGLIVSGVLVGFGTTVGNGCTSGHGVCGFPDFQKISFLRLALLYFLEVYCFYNWEDNLMIKIMFNLFLEFYLAWGLRCLACLIPLKSNHFLIFLDHGTHLLHLLCLERL